MQRCWLPTTAELGQPTPTPSKHPAGQTDEATRSPNKQMSWAGVGRFQIQAERPPAGPFCRSQIPLPPHHLPTLSGSGEKPSQFVNGSSFELMGAVPLSVFFSSPRRPLIRCGSPRRLHVRWRAGRGETGGNTRSLLRQLSVDDAGTMHTPDVASTWPESLPHPHATSSFLRQGTISLPEFP